MSAEIPKTKGTDQLLELEKKLTRVNDSVQRLERSLAHFVVDSLEEDRDATLTWKLLIAGYFLAGFCFGVQYARARSERE